MTACTYAGADRLSYAGTDRLSYCHGHRVEVLCTTHSCHHLFGEVS